jgi:hypothetical protein
MLCEKLVELIGHAWFFTIQCIRHIRKNYCINHDYIQPWATIGSLHGILNGIEFGQNSFHTWNKYIGVLIWKKSEGNLWDTISIPSHFLCFFRVHIFFNHNKLFCLFFFHFTSDLKVNYSSISNWRIWLS